MFINSCQCQKKNKNYSANVKNDEISFKKTILSKSHPSQKKLCPAKVKKIFIFFNKSIYLGQQVQINQSINTIIKINF